MENSGGVVVLAGRGDVEGVRAWITENKQSEGSANKITSALIVAAKEGHAGVVEVLIKEGGASADTRDMSERVRPVNC